MRTISILGSTGSIGTQTLDVVKHLGNIKVAGLTGNQNVKLMEEQYYTYRPSKIAMMDMGRALQLRKKLAAEPVTVLWGMEGLMEIASMKEVDMVVTSVVGNVGIAPTFEAIRHGKDIALANKETLVTAGHVIMPLAKEKGVQILPVDSEHSAIFQCLNGENRLQIEKILLTASGGPFLGKKKEQLFDITPEQALKHPNWSMGKKITIDSATMVNKGLEVMEAKWLFGVEVENIQVVVQPKSIIHSMVEWKDGAIIAQLGTPDMKLPIQYALYYPERRFLAGERLDFWKLSEITFEKPDIETFQGLALAYQAMKQGGSMPTVFNATNELAVSEFLKGKLSFLGITEWIREAIQAHKTIKNPTVDEILETEQWTREWILSNYSISRN